MSVESMNASNVTATVQPSVSQPVQKESKAEIKADLPAAATANAQAEMTAEEMQAVVDKLNEFMHNDQRNINFTVDTETDETIVKVMDTETQEVIRQFPSEEALKLTKHIEGMMGLIFNDHA